MGFKMGGFFRSDSGNSATDAAESTGSEQSSPKAAPIFRTTPLSPRFRCSVMGSQKVLRSTSWMSGGKDPKAASKVQPSVGGTSPPERETEAKQVKKEQEKRISHARVSSLSGAASPSKERQPSGSPNSLPPPPNVWRTQSAGELEHYRMTSGILQVPYKDVTDSYDLGEELGTGSSGVIRRCVNRRTKVAFACKTILKSKLQCQDSVEDVQNEVRIMQMLGDHPSIVGLIEVFEDQKAVHLILELCEGGDLYDRIQHCRHYPEIAAARVCRRLISVLQHCQNLGIMHRDLKPENILLLSEDSPVNIRVADFGQATFARQGGKPLTQAVGSVFYIAPEVLKKSYGPAADMWSVGVVLYILLSGAPPFAGPNRKATFELIQKSPLELERGPWKRVSADAKDLVRRMLDRDPAQRITASQAKVHPWMLTYCPPLPQPQPSIPVADTCPPASAPPAVAAPQAESPTSCMQDPTPRNLPNIRTSATAEASQASLAQKPPAPRSPSSAHRSPSSAHRSPTSANSFLPQSPASDAASSRSSSFFSSSPSPRSILSYSSLPSNLKPKVEKAVPPSPSSTPAPQASHRSSGLDWRFSLDVSPLPSPTASRSRFGIPACGRSCPPISPPSSPDEPTPAKGKSSSKEASKNQQLRTCRQKETSFKQVAGVCVNSSPRAAR